MNNEENIKTGPYATTTRLFSLPPSAQPDELRVGCLDVGVVHLEVVHQRPAGDVPAPARRGRNPSCLVLPPQTNLSISISIPPPAHAGWVAMVFVHGKSVSVKLTPLPADPGHPARRGPSRGRGRCGRPRGILGRGGQLGLGEVDTQP